MREEDGPWKEEKVERTTRAKRKPVVRSLHAYTQGASGQAVAGRCQTRRQNKAALQESHQDSMCIVHYTQIEDALYVH